MYTKICIRCKEVKNVEDFYVDMRSTDSHRSNCIKCCKELIKINYVKVTTKKCCNCEKKKSVDKFYKNCYGKDGLTSKCIICYRAYQKERNSSKEYKKKAAAYHRWYRKIQRDGKKSHPREKNKRNKVPPALLELQEKYNKLFKELHNQQINK